MKAQAKLYGPVHESVVFIVLLRRDIDEDSSKALLASSWNSGIYCTLKNGCRWSLKPNFMGQFTRAWFVSHMRAMKAQTRLCIHTVSQEPSLLSIKRNITQASGQLYGHVLDIKVLIFSLKKLYRWRLSPSIIWAWSWAFVLITLAVVKAQASLRFRKEGI